MKKKKMQFKAIIGILIIILVIRGLINAFTQEWYNEEYLLESVIDSASGFGVVEKYYVAGEEIFISAIPQDVSTGSIDSMRRGPYKIAFKFGRVIDNDDLNIKIHEIDIKSDQGRIFDLPDDVNFPIAVVTDREKSDTQYRYLIETVFDFKFNEKENIFITLDIEIEKDGMIKREEIMLKLMPVLEKGRSFWFPGIDV